MTPRSGFLLVLLLALVATGCAGQRASVARSSPAPAAGSDERAARDVLAALVRALEANRFDEAHALLSARWRAAYTPGQLGLDFRRGGPAIREAGARVASRLAAGDPIEVSGNGARLSMGAGRAAVLVLEAGHWRVDALE